MYENINKCFTLTTLNEIIPMYNIIFKKLHKGILLRNRRDQKILASFLGQIWLFVYFVRTQHFF